MPEETLIHELQELKEQLLDLIIAEETTSAKQALRQAISKLDAITEEVVQQKSTEPYSSAPEPMGVWLKRHQMLETKDSLPDFKYTVPLPASE